MVKVVGVVKVVGMVVSSGMETSVVALCIVVKTHNVYAASQLA